MNTRRNDVVAAWLTPASVERETFIEKQADNKDDFDNEDDIFFLRMIF